MDVLGTWTLESFEIEKDGVRRAWGRGVNGLLIYSATGHMSVSINKEIESDPDQSEAENLADSLLFYAGTFAVSGNVIRHQVTNASNPSRIGKEMVRYAEPALPLLTLTTPAESFGRAILVWKRV